VALLTVTQLREHVESDLPDAALERILDAEDAEIVRRFGALASESEELAGDARLLFLRRHAAAVTTVTETEADNATVTTLAANDFRQWGGGILERLATGDHPRAAWGPVVTVAYTPEDDSTERTHVLIQLCQLAARYTGAQHESVGQGDYAVTLPDYRRERERLLLGLAPRGGLWLA